MDVEVILTQTDPKYGTQGQVIKVSHGFAYNYLLPQRKAKLATPTNLKTVEAEKAKRVKEVAQAKANAQNLAETIKDLSLTVEVLTGEGDKLYGAVTSHEIQKVLHDKGISLEKKAIHLEEPIKQLGVFQIPVKLHPEVTATLKLWVVKKKV